MSASIGLHMVQSPEDVPNVHVRYWASAFRPYYSVAINVMGGDDVTLFLTPEQFAAFRASFVANSRKSRIEVIT